MFHVWFNRIKKNIAIYLIDRHLGDYFVKRIKREQLEIDLSKGYAVLENIVLDVQAVNDALEKFKLPFELVEGTIGRLYITIPWRQILTKSSNFKAEDMKLTFQPKQRPDCATSLIESVYTSVTSTSQLAEEFARQEAFSDEVLSTQRGVDMLGNAIASILRKVKVDFVKPVIQIEYIPKDSITGVGIVLNVDLISYTNEVTNEQEEDIISEVDDEPESLECMSLAYEKMRISFHNVTLSTSEFSSNSRVFMMHSYMTSSYASSEAAASVRESQNEVFYCMDEDPEAAPYIEKGTSPELPDNFKHVVMTGKLNGTQEISITSKQSENVDGPKVSFNINLSGLILFLSPRQVHLLSELFNGFAEADYDTTSDSLPTHKFKEKPMTNSDYEKVEQQLQQQIQSSYGPSHMDRPGWSSKNNEESDSEEKFYAMDNTTGRMYDSTASYASSSMESSVTSSVNSLSDQASRYHQKLYMEHDPTAEISHFNVRIASVAVLLLHEDVMSLSAENPATLIASSVQQMQTISECFFDKIGDHVISAFDSKDYMYTRKILEGACQRNHLRLFASPLMIEGNEKTTSTKLSVSLTATAAQMELLECLFEEDKSSLNYIPILVFDEVPLHSPRPVFNMSLKRARRLLTHRRFNRGYGPKTEIEFSLEECSVELDVTIVDRISALLNAPTICIIQKSRVNPWGIGSDLPNVDLNAVVSKLEIRTKSPNVKVRLRFPIPDFRPVHDMNKMPWWKRHVRPDFLMLSLIDFTFLTSFETDKPTGPYVFESRLIEAYYNETENSTPLLIAKTGFINSVTSPKYPDLRCRLRITAFSDKKTELSDPSEPVQDPMTHSLYGAFENQTNKQPGPFSAKKMVYQSDTPHQDTKDDPEEIIMPGNATEIQAFVRTTVNNTKSLMELFLPTVSLQLLSKHIYELLYNRINNDLLLWQPSAPKPKVQTYDNLNINVFENLNTSVPETFGLCKSGNQYESESDSEEEDSDEGAIYYSTYDYRTRYSSKQQQAAAPVQSLQNNMVISIQIDKCYLNLFTPCRNPSERVIPEHNGELMLNVESLNLYVVNGYQGDEDLSYFCVRVDNAQLYHCEIMSSPSPRPTVRMVGAPIPTNLKCIIHASEDGMLVDCKNRGNDHEFITVAVRVQANHETHHVKTARVSVGINKATLKHRMCREPNSWISQILDFFNVQDYPIHGYNAKEVLTEFHLHMWDCAIDYRPLFLPMRAAVTVGTFSMSSQLSAQANTSTLRFIFEECGLYISEKGGPVNGQPSNVPVDLINDYVNVIELGVFELSIRTNDKKSGINPHLDLRASNNALHIRTCADSGRALMDLITYIASDGDLMPADETFTSSSSYSSPRHHTDEDFIGVEEPRSLSKSQHQHIHDLISEAMEESIHVEQDDPSNPEPGAKMFFFPDEKKSEQDSGKPLPQVTTELGDITKQKVNKSSDTDDEFTFLENDGGPGRFPNDGGIHVKWLTKEPIVIYDNYYPKNPKRTDLLDTPEMFPKPVMRYTLCEMTVTWHMYGGNDFSSFGENKKRKTVSFESLGTGTVNFKNNNQKVTFTPAPQKSNIHWKVRGGVNRDHKVLMELQLSKVRFKHEVFPETNYYASRQVLLIHDVEVRDRLEDSSINKFLYLFTSNEKPKQTHAHMVHVRMVHIRPDVGLKSQECGIKISLLPLRLNIDQDSLLFLIDFFRALAGASPKEESEPVSSSKQNTPTHQPPVISVDSADDEEKRKEIARKMVDENLMLLMEESRLGESLEDSTVEQSTSDTGNNEYRPIYFRKVTFSPDVPIRVDYLAKRLEMKHGPIPGIVMGLGQLNCSEIILKSIEDRKGFLGLDKLVTFLLQEWVNDIKKHQLPRLLAGVGPIYSFMQLFSGIKDLFWMPIEQYQRDGRLVRGLQRGANSFTTSTAVAALELTSRLIYLIQITAETAYDMLSPGPSVRKLARGKGRKKRYNQPQDIREGVTNAITLLKEGLGETANNIAHVASKERDQKGYSGAVGGVIREVPSAIIKPIIIASAATSNVLGGMRSQLVPDARTEANQKWRSDDT